MDLETFLGALSHLGDPLTLIVMVIATFVGIVVGALPGLGTVTALAMVLPFTFALSAPQAIGMLLAIYVSSIFGGAIPAVLINVPGTPQSAATTFDGYPMAQKGHADEALGWVTMASTIGGLFSGLVLIFAAPQLASLAIRFGSIETLALIIFSLTTIAWVSSGSTLKGLLAGVVGLVLSTVGIDSMSGVERFTFGNFALSAGLHAVPILIGLFALSEVFMSAGKKMVVADAIDHAGFKIAPFTAWWRLKRTLLRSSLIGTFLGVLPGIGATAASLLSYSRARAASPVRDRFGTGEPEGLVSSEVANNAVTGGALVPTLALGIPGDAATAVMMGALIIHGVTPGVQLFAHNPDLIAFIFVALLAANVMMFLAGALTTRLFTRILRIPHALIMGFVVALALAGSFVVRASILDVWIAVVAGMVGFLLRLANVPLAPIVIGFILGPSLETSLRQGLILTQMNPVRFFERPIASLIFAVTFLVVSWPLMRTVARRREMRREP
ncbi:hypothetical protein MesoLjLc_30990 [Mesorhizobium sp. L-8-10]|uniref:tripartite tricarboxylate transporter permease n=1 Tax=unclassified Mesorhizobium TaxID=325217 RepID=UPI001925F109|nr:MULTISPECIES: tripartite tricarboxylate transporter permease [unclassified Mesorhizobium]BCH23398.1 hypothetical protein MesoLjLb_31830 [Mesorhizobium sp. L-8-3]BCH31169.1 hypothetical protein MesoLjLc_30990 [Mesorhizobium sp. L-8-10]